MCVQAVARVRGQSPGEVAGGCRGLPRLALGLGKGEQELSVGCSRPPCCSGETGSKLEADLKAFQVTQHLLVSCANIHQQLGAQEGHR